MGEEAIEQLVLSRLSRTTYPNWIGKLISPINVRLRYLSSQFLREPIQLLQSIQSCNCTSILNSITKEGRQDLDLLSGQELRWQRLNDRGEEADSLSTQYRIFIIDVLAKLLNNLYQGSLLALDICIESLN